MKIRLNPSRPFFKFCASFALLAATPAAAETQAWLTQPDQMADVFLNDLNHAKKRIDLIAADLSDQVLFEELQAAAARKTKIRIILSNKEQGMNAWQCVPCSSLESAGVDIKYMDVAIPSNFAVIDGPRTRFSSGRFGTVLVFQGRVATGEAKQLIKFSKSGEYVLSFQDEFNYIWSKASDYGDSARQKKSYAVRVPAVPGVFFTSTNMIPVKTPKGWVMTPSLDSKTGVIENFAEGAVNYAFKSVDISTNSLTNTALIRAAVRAHDRGVRVRIIVDRTSYNGSQSAKPCNFKNISTDTSIADECLSARGIQIIYRSNDRLEANQGSIGYIIVDRKLVLSGPVGIQSADEFNTLNQLIVLRDSAHDAFARNFSLQMSHAIRTNGNLVIFKK